MNRQKNADGHFERFNKGRESDIDEEEQSESDYI